MTPTNLLRFVERDVPMFPGIQTGFVRTILQQWWTDKDAATPTGEWRDVPLEKEA